MTVTTMKNKLIVTFWHVVLGNFPDGEFRRRTLETNEAKELIDTARQAGLLKCAVRDDILADHAARKREKYLKLIKALNDELNIELPIGLFTLSVEEGENPVSTIYPLHFVEISTDTSLLVVNCNYEFKRNENAQTIDEKLDFPIATDSITFHLFDRFRFNN